MKLMVGIILGGAFAVTSYSIYAIIFNLTPLKTTLYIEQIRKIGQKTKKLSAFLTRLSKPLTKYIPLGMVKHRKIEKMLTGIQSSETPKELIARIIVTFLFWSIFGFPLFLFSNIVVKIIGGIYIFMTLLMSMNIYAKLKQQSQEQSLNIQFETPRLIESVAHNLKTNRNVLVAFDAYIENFNGSYLSTELSKTVSDMRTGSDEIALNRLALRLQDPYISQFVKAIISALHGENMTSTFADLILKVQTKRKEYLRMQAMKVKPKIKIMSFIRMAWIVLVLLFVLMAGAMSLTPGG